jgi:EAL domain-containing protein (putative c-di-GMP-specific phosphodiesterase class I)
LFVLLEIDVLHDIIQNSGVDPSEIKLEITESMMRNTWLGRRKTKSVGHSASHRRFRHRLFQSQLSASFPFRYLKIDRAFVVNME